MATVAFCCLLSDGEVAQQLLDAIGAIAKELEATLIRISLHGSLHDADVDTIRILPAAIKDGFALRHPAASPSRHSFFKVEDVCELFRSTASADKCHVMPRHVTIQVLEVSGAWSSPQTATQELRLILDGSPTLLAAVLQAASGPWEQRKETVSEVHGNRGKKTLCSTVVIRRWDSIACTLQARLARKQLFLWKRTQMVSNGACTRPAVHDLTSDE